MLEAANYMLCNQFSANQNEVTANKQLVNATTEQKVNTIQTLQTLQIH